jgi:hypothetical protein
MTIKVISKGSKTSRAEGSVCPWVMDVPPETPRS